MPSLDSARAIVSRGRHDEGKWAIEPVIPRSTLRDDELLVSIVASGICHTDVMFGDDAESIGGWPRVMGHEGSGYVKQIGSNVTRAKVGDPVLLSFAACRKCKMCVDGDLSHCVRAWEINFFGVKSFYSPENHTSNSIHTKEPEILGSFFGQSSFANSTVVNESSVVNVLGLIKSDEELKIFAPLGCGIQTGSGTIVNVAKASPKDSVAIIGAGGVGLAALMGARISGCKPIIVIDRVAHRLAFAKELGATHTIDTTGMQDLNDLVRQVRDITGGYGTSITMDATGVVPLIEKGLEFTARRGQYIQVGSTKPDAVLKIPLQDFMTEGKRFMGAVEGQVVPTEYIPRMIQWYRQGQFPIDKLMKIYPAEEFMDAIHGMESGDVIKPIITWW